MATDSTATAAALDTSAQMRRDGQSSSEASGAPQRENPKRWVVLAIAAVATAFVWVDATALNIAFPALERTFPGAPRSDISWVLNGYNVVFAAFLVPAGRLADILGRKRLFLLGVAVFASASALCAFAPSLEVLVACRLLQGAGAAAMLPAGFALVLAAFPLAELPSAVALWVTAGSVAGALGPVVGGLVIHAGSWRWIFLLNVPAGILVLTLGLRSLREVRGSPQQLPDLIGTVAVAAGIACLSMAILQGRQWGWANARTLAAVIAVPIFLGFAVRRSAVHPAPALDLPLLRQRRAAVANLGTLLFGMAVFGGILTNVLFLSEGWHYSALQAALAVTPPPLTAAVTARAAGRAITRYGPRPVGALGVLLFASGMAFILVRATASPNYLGAWLPGTLLFGAGIGVASPAFASTAMRSAPIQAFGLASSINTAARQIGAVLGVAVLVAVIGSPDRLSPVAPFHHAWIADIALTALAGLCAMALRPAVASTVPAATSAVYPSTEEVAAT